MNRKTIPATALLLLAVSLPATAEVLHFPVDPAHSQVGFTVRHIISNVPGRFAEFSGDVWVDPDDVVGTLKIEGTVKAASVDTNNEKRDKHLASADFFDAADHPEIKFVTKSVKKKGEEYLVTGDLTIRGVTKTVDFAADLHGFATHPFTNTPMTALDLTATIIRQDFGINWNKTLDQGGLLVGNEVTIDVRLEAVVEPTES